jgi:hypothetical protein
MEDIIDSRSGEFTFTCHLLDPELHERDARTSLDRATKDDRGRDRADDDGIGEMDLDEGILPLGVTDLDALKAGRMA